MCKSAVNLDPEVKAGTNADQVKPAHKPVELKEDGEAVQYTFSPVWASRGTLRDGEKMLEEEGDALMQRLISTPLKPDECLWTDHLHKCFVKFAEHPCLSFRPYQDQEIKADDLRVSDKYKKGKLRRAKSYTSWTYKKVHEYILKTAGLIETLGRDGGLKNDLGDRNIAIWGKNCVEYYISIMACWHQNAAFVPLYDTLGLESFKHILGNTGCKAIFLQKAKLDDLIGILKDRSYPNPLTKSNTDVQIESVVLFDHLEERNDEWELVTDADKEALKAVGVKNVYGFWEYLRRTDGVPADAKVAPSSSDDTSIIMHTSGTTGLPKGVVLKRRCMLQSYDLTKYQHDQEQGSTQWKLGPGDRHYSYLPLGHIFEVGSMTGVIVSGVHLYITGGNLTEIADELKLVRPTAWNAVPRVLQKFYDKVMLIASEGAKGKLIGNVIKWQTANVLAGKRNKCLDVILKKVIQKLGVGSVKFLGTGSAPLPDYLHTFWRTLIPGVHLAQGYGMTETTMTGTLQRPNDPNKGHCGPPMPGTLIMLRENDEIRAMDYSVKNQEGEVLIGGNVGTEYYRQPVKTAETFLELYGIKWVCSGDIGRMNTGPQTCGTLSIIDRKKSLFKLAQGEYVSPSKVEALYMEGPSVNQIWVYGHSEMTQIVAVVVPAIDWVYKQSFFTESADPSYKMHMTDKGVKLGPGSNFFMLWMNADFENRYKTLKDAIWQEFVEKVGTRGDAKAKGFEKLKKPEAFYLETELGLLATGFTVENGLVTPSMKMQRPKIAKKYLAEKVLQKMYRDLGEKLPEDWEK